MVVRFLACAALAVGLLAWCVFSYCLLGLVLPPVPLYVPALAVVASVVLVNKTERPASRVVLMLSVLWAGVELLERVLPAELTLRQILVGWVASGLLTLVGVGLVAVDRRRRRAAREDGRGEGR